jgi:hypothetical protein
LKKLKLLRRNVKLRTETGLARNLKPILTRRSVKWHFCWEYMEGLGTHRDMNMCLELLLWDQGRELNLLPTRIEPPCSLEEI